MFDQIERHPKVVLARLHDVILFTELSAGDTEETIHVPRLDGGDDNNFGFAIKRRGNTWTDKGGKGQDGRKDQSERAQD